MYLSNIIKRTSLCLLVGIFVFTSCYKESDYLYSADEIFENLCIEISKDRILADGKSSSVITYRIPENADTTLTRLLLAATNGTFLESGDTMLVTNFSKLDLSKTHRLVETTLIASTKPSISIISSSLLNYTRKDTIVFQIAFPDSISLISVPYYIKNNDIKEINIIATVLTDTGIASKGRLILYSVSPPAGFLQSQYSLSDAFGKSIVQYVFTDTSFVGNITFMAKTINASGDTLESTCLLRVID